MFIIGNKNIRNISLNVKLANYNTVRSAKYFGYDPVFYACILTFGRLCGLVGSALDHRSLPSEFESQCGYL